MPVLAPPPAERGLAGDRDLFDRQASDAESAPLSASPPDALGVLEQIDVDDVGDVPVLAHREPSRASGWRIERFGAPGHDGKGRYWQWRAGSGKNRRSAYGGKI